MKLGSWNYVIITDYLSDCQIIREKCEREQNAESLQLEEEPRGFSSSLKKKEKEKRKSLLQASHPLKSACSAGLSLQSKPDGAKNLFSCWLSA